MNTAITVGYKSGAAYVVADPSVSIAEQKRAFKHDKFDEYEKIELWTKSCGCEKSRKIRTVRPQTIAVAPKKKISRKRKL